MSARRLLPSIVFASTSLLACGQIAFEEPDAETPTKDASADTATKDSGSHEDVIDSSMPDVIDSGPDVKDAGPDVRACDGGWPTTKGQICTFEAGIVCCTPSFGEDGGIECCDRGM